MPTAFAFTQKRLASLPVPKTGRTTYHDTKTPGLCIRVSNTGHQAAYLSRKLKSRHVKLKLGTWPQDFGTVKALRDAAQAALADMEGLATRRRQTRQEATLGDLWARWEDYMVAHKKPKSQTEDRRLYERFLRRWARRPLSEVSHSDVAGLHARIGRDNGKYLANRMLALASAMFSEARRAGLFSGDNPCRDIRRFREESRDRWLDASELKRFFDALHQELDLFRDYFLLLLLTGVRKSDLLVMRWEHLDLRRGLWRIPDGKANVPVVVPLVEPAAMILRRRKRVANGAGWVFPGRHGKGHLTDPYPAWRRICRRAKLRDARIHDIRRTLGSWMATQGTSLPVIGKTLGHRSLAATEVYARLSVEPVKQAVDKATTAMLEAGGLLEGPGKKTEN